MPTTQATDPREKLASRLTPEMAMQFGKLAGADRRTVVITADRNPSSMMMVQSVIAGVVSIGGTAQVLKDVPAPSAPFCGIPYNYHINISSLNPNMMCGMEIFDSKGAYISSMEVFNMTYREMGLKYPGYNELGSIFYNGDNAKLLHSETLMAKVQDCNCQVVLDGTYYRPAKMTSKILSSLNADVILEKRPGSRYLPGLGETELQDLQKMMYGYKGSIGLALNSDATRIAAFDDKGRYINAETIAVIFAKYMNLKKVTAPIDITMSLDEAVKANGGVVVKAGHSFRSAVDAGTTNGSDMILDSEGHFVFTDTSFMSDAIHAGLKLAEINGKEKLSRIIDEIDPFSKEYASIRTQANKNDVYTNIRKIVEEEGYAYIDTGSTRIEFDDGWILIHIEENDDSVSITCEGRDKAYALSLMDIAKWLVESSIKRCS